MTESNQYSFEQLAELVPGSRILGDSKYLVDRIAHPTAVEKGSDLVLLLSKGYLEMGASMSGDKPGIVVGEDLVKEAEGLVNQFPAVLVLDRPRLALAYLTPLFPRIEKKQEQKHASSFIHESAYIGEGCYIGPLCYVGERAIVGKGSVLMSQVTIEEGAELGENCVCQAGARVADGVTIGNRVILNQNCVVGSDGFSFITPEANSAEEAKGGRTHSTEGKAQSILRIDSLGTVVIEDDVEVGAGTMIDRGTLGVTRIKRGTKIDNLVQIGHNNTIGEDGLLCALVGIAGSCVVGDRVVMAGRASIADGKKVTDDVVLLGKSGTTKDVEESGVYAGFPSRPAKETLRSYANIAKLDEMRKEIRELKKLVQNLSEKS